MNMPLNEIRSKYKQARAETKTYATETFVGHSNSIWGKPKLFKMPGKCRFNNAWLRNEKYMSWVSSDKDPGRAKCRLCGDKTFDISNMGEAALTSHAKGAKHHHWALLLAEQHRLSHHHSQGNCYGKQHVSLFGQAVVNNRCCHKKGSLNCGGNVGTEGG